MNYMGIDHHKQYSHMTILDEKGDVIKAGRVLNRRQDVEEFVGGFHEDLRAVIEAGRATYTMVDLLEELGVDIKMAHPLQVKAIAQAKIKTDKRDSKILAHLLRTDLIPEVYRREPANRASQRILRHRMAYVRMQTQLKNRIRSLLAQQREEVREMVERQSLLFSRRGMTVLKELKLPGKDDEMLKSLIKTFDHIQRRIRQSDSLVEEIYDNCEEARLIHTIPGFGKFFSVLVTTEIADIGRFASAAKLHSYVGVIPSTHASGEKSYHGKLINQGNKWLRWALVEAVWPAIRADFDLRVFYQRLAKRKAPNSAKIATARRLLTIVYRVLKEKRPYVPYKR
ncbi:MAG: IS110 family transposase [Acidobacteriota bacterium]